VDDAVEEGVWAEAEAEEREAVGEGDARWSGGWGEGGSVTAAGADSGAALDYKSLYVSSKIFSMRCWSLLLT